MGLGSALGWGDGRGEGRPGGRIYTGVGTLEGGLNGEISHLTSPNPPSLHPSIIHLWHSDKRGNEKKGGRKRGGVVLSLYRTVSPSTLLYLFEFCDPV